MRYITHMYNFEISDYLEPHLTRQFPMSSTDSLRYIKLSFHTNTVYIEVDSEMEHCFRAIKNNLAKTEPNSKLSIDEGYYTKKQATAQKYQHLWTHTLPFFKYEQSTIRNFIETMNQLDAYVTVAGMLA